MTRGSLLCLLPTQQEDVPRMSSWLIVPLISVDSEVMTFLLLLSLLISFLSLFFLITLARVLSLLLIFLENQLFVSSTFVYALLISVLSFSALIFSNFLLGDFCFSLFFFFFLKFYVNRTKKRLF